MPVTSVYAADAHEQKGGGRYVTEDHTDSGGRVHRIVYGPVPDGFDYAGRAAANGARLAEQLADDEATGLWGDGVWRALVHQTASQLAARFRAKYRDATALEAARMAWWLIQRIAAGNFTDAQVRSAFGLTTTQYNQMKTRMQTLHDQYAAVIAARGE